jgi:hypothetical protein
MISESTRQELDNLRAELRRLGEEMLAATRAKLQRRV